MFPVCSSIVFQHKVSPCCQQLIEYVLNLLQTLDQIWRPLPSLRISFKNTAEFILFIFTQKMTSFSLSSETIILRYVHYIRHQLHIRQKISMIKTCQNIFFQLKNSRVYEISTLQSIGCIYWLVMLITCLVSTLILFSPIRLMHGNTSYKLVDIIQ